jgi:hypothetical protein
MNATRLVLSSVGISLLAFPLAGYAGWGISGHVDALMPALLGGAITGAGVGLVQWLFLRRLLDVSPIYIAVTSVALAVGLAMGAAVVGYETATAQLAVMGAISGAFVGVAQGVVLRDRFSLWQAWMAAMPPLFAIGWTVSASIGVDVANQFTVFGASGSIVFGILSGLILAAGDRNHPA